MAYFYDNNVRKIPGPSYVFDFIFRYDILPSNINLNKTKPSAYDSYEGTAWQKVVDNVNDEIKVTFALVADKYTNPIEGMTSDEMLTIWKHVWGEDWQ